MSSLGFQSCFNHPIREAVGRCPECSRAFCRECITDHDDRILCAGCIQKLSRASREARPARRIPWQVITLPVKLAAGVAIAWLSFYTVGRLLLAIPSEFHSGAVWNRFSETDDSE